VTLPHSNGRQVEELGNDRHRTQGRAPTSSDARNPVWFKSVRSGLASRADEFQWAQSGQVREGEKCHQPGISESPPASRAVGVKMITTMTNDDPLPITIHPEVHP
jgi:hypothetical protein